MIGIARSKTESWILSVEASCHQTFEMHQESWNKAISAFLMTYQCIDVKLLLFSKMKLVFGGKGTSVMDKHRDWWNACWSIEFY